MAQAFTSMFQLTTQQLRGMFECSFAGWTVTATKIDASSGHVHGVIWRGDEQVGSFWRVVQMQDRCVHHVSFSLAAGKGEGFARQWFARCFEAYAAAGITSVRAEAQTDGRIAWARLGFAADSEDEWQRVLGEVDRLMRSQVERGDADMHDLRCWRMQRAELEGLGPHGMDQLSRVTLADGTPAIAKINWRARRDLSVQAA